MAQAYSEKQLSKPRNNLLAKLKARPWLSAGICLLLLGVILALVLGLALGLRKPVSTGSASNSDGQTPATLVSIAGTPPASPYAPLQPNFVSFAIEYAFLPEFAGNTSAPNTFSYNVISNFANITGVMPHVRVGGNSADLALFDSDQFEAAIVSYRSVNGTTRFGDLTIGPSFFESFSTWPDVKFIVGLNLKNATLTDEGRNSLLANVAESCSGLKDKLLWWEYGNEPDLYHRDVSSWNATVYSQDWLDGVAAIKETLQAHCPDMAGDARFGFVGPSLFRFSRLPPADILANGYNKDNLIKEYAMHHFMADCSQVACNQQSMLLNHTYLKSSMTNITNQMSTITSVASAMPSSAIAFVIDEMSMFLIPNAAPNGTSDTFGAALWALDFSLYCASIGISRIHMQQGTGFNYNAWSPVTLENFPMDVFPTYYGEIAAASAIGNFSGSQPSVVTEIELPDADEFESAYAVYLEGKTLARIVLINLNQFNETSGASSRANRTYSFALPNSTSSSVALYPNGFSMPVSRLTAAGADSKDGLSFAGLSYQYNLAQGRASKVPSVPNERLIVAQGQVKVSVPDSSAVVLDFQAGAGP